MVAVVIVIAEIVLVVVDTVVKSFLVVRCCYTNASRKARVQRCIDRLNLPLTSYRERTPRDKSLCTVELPDGSGLDERLFKKLLLDAHAQVGSQRPMKRGLLRPSRQTSDATEVKSSRRIPRVADKDWAALSHSVGHQRRISSRSASPAPVESEATGRRVRPRDRIGAHAIAECHQQSNTPQQSLRGR